MKLQKIIFLAVAAAVFPLAGRSAVTADVAVQPPAVLPTMDARRNLSGQANEVVKLVSSGVSSDVVKAYIGSAPSTFNLSSENIIHLQQLGVSGPLLTEMLNHDRAVRQMAAATLPPGAEMYPPNAPQPPDNGYDNSQPQPDTDYYGQLSPYGNWNYVPDYGWAWQPYGGLAYSAYPWGVLGLGYWWDCPGFGWCWFPRGGFGFRGFHGFDRGFHGGFRGGFRGGFAGRGFGGFGRSAPGFRSFGGFHGSVGGFHGSMGGGFHGFGGHSGGFSRGGGGFSHGGGGFGGGHGGGGHR